MFNPSSMWRAFFCAVGIVLIILGLECLVIDSAVFVAGVMDDPSAANPQANWFNSTQPNTAGRTFKPTDWFPWALLASGAIVSLYSVSIRPSST
jgi:hypothetical protein